MPATEPAPHRCTAVVLTAGRSRRMGCAKAFLCLDGEPLLSRVVRAAQGGGASGVVVVVGAERSATLVDRAGVRRLLDDAGLTATLTIGAPDGHPIDSLRRGLAEIPAGSGVLLWPVDHPFAGAALVRSLIAAWAGAAERIVIPRAGQAWGHPVLLGPAVVEELGGPAADGGAHRVVRRDPTRWSFVESDDPRIACDLDTPDEAAATGVRLLRVTGDPTGSPSPAR